MNLRSLAGASTFAHLVGLGRSSKKGGSDDDEEMRRGETEGEEECEDDEPDDEASSERGNGGGRKTKKKVKKKTKKAGGKNKGGDGDDGDGDDDAEDSESDETEDDEDGDEDDEDEADDDREGKKAAAFKSGRKVERARIARILSCPAAANNIQLACRLACNTGMSSATAIALIEAQGSAPRRGRLSDRMADAPRLGPDAPPATTEQASGKLWDVALTNAGLIPKK